MPQFPTIPANSAATMGQSTTASTSQQGFNFGAFTSSTPSLRFGGTNSSNTMPQGPMIFGAGGGPSSNTAPPTTQSSQLFEFSSGNNQQQQAAAAPPTIQFNPGKTTTTKTTGPGDRKFIKAKRRLK